MKRAASVVRRPAATCVSAAWRRASGRCAWLFACLVILLGGIVPVEVSAVTPVATVDPVATETLLTPTDCSPELVDGEMPSLSPPVYRAGIVEYILGNRSRMIQIATLMMLLGLFILMRK